MNNLFLFFISLLCICLTSCIDKKYESNAVLLKKAIKAANDNGEWEAAKALAFKAREQDVNDANARVMFALALEQCDDLDRAVEEIKIASTLDPENFMAHYTKGRLLFKTEIFEDCPDPLETAKELKPDNPQVLLLLARTYALLNINNKAIKNYVALAKNQEYKDSPEVYNELGVLFYNKKDYKRSVRFLNKAFSKNDKAPAVCFNLGVFWDTLTMICKDDPSKASKAAKNAIKYYNVYIGLIKVNPKSEPQRRKVLERIEVLSKF